MSARDDLIYRITRHCSDETAQDMVNAHQAEVVADLVDRCAIALANCCPECDAAIAIVRSRGQRLLEGAPVPERNGAEETTPGFFQPGHVYAHGNWQFHCATITTHPETGMQTALGWTRVGASGWTTYSHSVAEWGPDWTDVTGQVAG